MILLQSEHLFIFRSFRNIQEAVAQRCSVKKLFLKMLPNAQENTCVTASFLRKFQAWGLELY